MPRSTPVEKPSAALQPKNMLKSTQRLARARSARLSALPALVLPRVQVLRLAMARLPALTGLR
jgi:hypothetical protein